MCFLGEHSPHVCALGVLHVCAFVYFSSRYPRGLLLVTRQQRLHFVRVMRRACRVGRMFICAVEERTPLMCVRLGVCMHLHLCTRRVPLPRRFTGGGEGRVRLL